MNRSTFAELSEQRLRDAKALLDASRYAAAYYLAGYAVECGLKACIAKKTRRSSFPPKATIVTKCYTHDLSVLALSAGLDQALQSEMGANAAFKANWLMVKDWNEESRYVSHSQ